MKNSPEFNARLIRLVEKYPPLYNSALDQSSDKKEIEKIWQEIAGILNETVTNCVVQWTTLKSNFIRLVRENVRYHTGLQKPKHFYLAKSMQFLLPYLKLRHDSNDTDVEMTEAKRKNPNTKDALFHQNIGDACTVVTLPKRHLRAKTSKNSTFNESLLCSEMPDIPEKLEKSEKCEKPEKLEKKIPITKTNGRKYYEDALEALYPSLPKKLVKGKSKKSGGSPEQTSKKMIKDYEKNSDKAFFLSLLPLVSKLSDTQRIRFRINTMQILENIVDGGDYNNVSLLKLGTPPPKTIRSQMPEATSSEPSLLNLNLMQ